MLFGKKPDLKKFFLNLCARENKLKSSPPFKKREKKIMKNCANYNQINFVKSACHVRT